jgi:hypothetical protein
MVGEWRVRIILIHNRSLHVDVILPISANVDDVIKLCYRYVNHVGIWVEYKLDFNINGPLYIRPLSSDDVISIITDRPIINNDMFGAMYISDVDRYTPLAAIYTLNDINIWEMYGVEREILIGCTVSGQLNALDDLSTDRQLLSNCVLIPSYPVEDRLMEVTVQYLINDELVYYNMKDFKMDNSILLYVIDVNIVNCWVVGKTSSNIIEIVSALKINPHLLPRVILGGFNNITKVYPVLSVGEALCDHEEFVMIFGTTNFIDRSGNSSISAMMKEFPYVVEYGRRQYEILESLGETIWQY